MTQNPNPNLKRQTTALANVVGQIDRAKGLVAKRDALIVQLSEAGMTLREIAEVADLSHQGVADVIKRARVSA